MRLALRIVAGLTFLCIPVGLAFILATAGTGGDVSPLFLPGFGFIALGLLGAVATDILALVASAMARQFAWLIATIVAALIPLIGVPLLNVLTGYVDNTTANALVNAYNALLLAGPVLIALVVFIHSFLLRDVRNPATVGAPPPANTSRPPL
jgi:hypothetical protein